MTDAHDRDKPGARRLLGAEFGYLGRSHHVSRTSLRELFPYFRIEEPPQAKPMLDYFDQEQSAMYLHAVGAIGGWLDFLPALPTRAIPDRSTNDSEALHDPIALAHHAYFEATLALGDSLAAGCGGHARAGLALLRPFVEFAVTEVYVNEQEDEARLHDFLTYLRGSGHRPRFRTMLDEIFAEERFATVRSYRALVDLIYAGVSSWLHVPTVADSGLDMRAGNTVRSTVGETVYWMSILGIAVQRMLALMVLRYPMVLFPVDRIRRFGYGGPVGLVVDEPTSASILEGLGERHADALRGWLADDPEVTSIRDWVDSYPELSDEEIEADWERFASGQSDPDQYRATPKDGRAAMQVAAMGGMAWALDRVAASRYLAVEADLDPEEVFKKDILATELRPYYRRAAQRT